MRRRTTAGCASRCAKCTPSTRAARRSCTARSRTSSRVDGLSEAHKAALRYVDALIWSPSQISDAVAAGVRRHFSEQQSFELTLDVMRNAANKIAVALAADAPRVAEGTERYEIDEAGQTIFA